MILVVVSVIIFISQIMFGHCCGSVIFFLFFFFKQKTAYEMRISDWSSDVCSSDLKRALTPDQEMHIRQMICDKRPEQLTMEFALWSRAAVCELIERECEEIGRASCRERVCQYV